MKMLLFSGPPSSGKDTAAKYIHKNWWEKPRNGSCLFERLSAPLKRTFAVIANKKVNEYCEVEYYEEHKEEIIPWFGVSFRDYQINLAEQHFKKLYGHDIFVKMFFNYTFEANKRTNVPLVVVPDLGFNVEVRFLEDNYGSLDDLLIVRTHREGYDFSKDSREYVDSNKIRCIDVTNNGSLDRFRLKIDTIFNLFMIDKIEELNHFSIQGPAK